MGKIIKLEVSNFKRIEVAEIEPGDGAVLIAGRNAQGKSSVLDAIDALLRGGKAYPDVPVRKGASKATMRCELDDGMVIERGITSGGTTSLKIVNRDGMSPQSPQAWLDARMSAATCDPLAFLRAKPQDQAAELRRLTGLDTTEIDAERKRIYDQRTQDGRIAKQKAAELVGAPMAPDGTPDEPVSAAGIAEELDAARGVEAAKVRLLASAAQADAEAKAAALDAEEALAGAIVNAKEMRAEAADLLARAEQLNLDAEKEEARGAEAKADLLRRAEEDAANAKAIRADADGRSVPDIAEIRARLAAVDATNAAVRTKLRRLALEKEAQGWQAKVDGATKDIADIDTKRLAMLDGVTWPVDGLGISDGVVTFHGFPLSQASQAEQLRVGLGLALAGNPEIRIALLRDGAHLDDEALAALAAHAESAGAQVWVERVGTHDAGAVVIEDGRVVRPSGDLL